MKATQELRDLGQSLSFDNITRDMLDNGKSISLRSTLVATKVSLELGAYSAMCCSYRFTGHLAVDGTTISGDFPPRPDQSPNVGFWTERPGNTCVDAADLPKTHPKCEPSR